MQRVYGLLPLLIFARYKHSKLLDTPNLSLVLNKFIFHLYNSSLTVKKSFVLLFFDVGQVK